MSVLPPQGRGLSGPTSASWQPSAAPPPQPAAAAEATAAPGPTFAGWGPPSMGQYFPPGMPFPQGPPLSPGLPLGAPLGAPFGPPLGAPLGAPSGTLLEPPSGAPPSTQGGPPPPPQLEVANMQIAALMDLYQQQLVEISAAHSLLLADQERLAALLAPFVDASGAAVMPLDENLLFLKRGLDLRLLEFEEDCRRIQKTEKRLQRQLDELSLGYDAMVLEAQGFAESRLMGQVKDLRKVVSLLQFELDELRFQRDVYADEAKRLRGVCRYGNWVQDGLADPLTPRKISPRSLHQKYSGAPVQRKAEAVIGKASGRPSRREEGEPLTAAAAEEEEERPEEEAAPVWTRIFSGLLPGSKGAPKDEEKGGRGKGASTKGASSRGPPPPSSTNGGGPRGTTHRRRTDIQQTEPTYLADDLQPRRKTAAGLGGGPPYYPQESELTGGAPAARRVGAALKKEAFSGVPGAPREAPPRRTSSPHLPPSALPDVGGPSKPKRFEEQQAGGGPGGPLPPHLLRTRSSDVSDLEPVRLPPHSHSDEGPPQRHAGARGPHRREAPFSLSGSSSERSEEERGGASLLIERTRLRSSDRPRRYSGQEEKEDARGGKGPSGAPQAFAEATPQEQLLGRISRLGSRTIPSPHAGSPAESGRPGMMGGPPSAGGPTPSALLPSRQASVAFLGSVEEEERHRDSSSSSTMGGPSKRGAAPRRLPSRSLSRSPSAVSLIGTTRTLVSPRASVGGLSSGAPPWRPPVSGTGRTGSSGEFDLRGPSAGPHGGSPPYRAPPLSDSRRAPITALDLSKLRGPPGGGY